MSDVIQHITDQFKADGNLAELRSRAMENFSRLGLPTVKHEEWRYTRIGSIFQKDLELGVAAELSVADLEGIRLPGKENAIEIYFVNGVFKIATATEDISILPLEEAAAGEFAGLVKEH